MGGGEGPLQEEQEVSQRYYIMLKIKIAFHRMFPRMEDLEECIGNIAVGRTFAKIAATISCSPAAWLLRHGKTR
jgi:hypothetical protein